VGEGREILFEFIRIGESVRVAAIDSETGLEAVAIGPAHAACADLEQLALRKLMRKLEAEKPPPSRFGGGRTA
jgi:hypothetical protein